MFDLYDTAAFPIADMLAKAVEVMASNNDPESRGAIYTRVEVVDFILDLVGYTDDQILFQKRILEPSMGGGDFLLPIIDRLLSCWQKHVGSMATATDELGEAIYGVELHKETFDSTREKVISRLESFGMSYSKASGLADQWLMQGDYLLEKVPGRFDYIVGNPPYVRQEQIPGALLAEYRRRFSTLYDRADLYVPFIERSLSLLANNGALGFICSDQMSLIRRIERQYPELEQVGCRVGIGVATGADEVFIGTFDLLDVEVDRKLPLVTTKDIQSGEIVWRGLGVINPFAEDGSLVALEEYPCFARYVESRRDMMSRRHCAKKAPDKWYRTIDRIWPELTHRPKLLIPDIKGEANIVFDSGRFYPHHNLYYVVSDTWDLRALQAVLLSSLTKLFISTYSTQMRGGYLRFQAQYLRRIRLPFWKDVPENLRQELIKAGCVRSQADCDKAVFRLYGLNHDERAALGGNGE